jgi:hypothetical protein
MGQIYFPCREYDYAAHDHSTKDFEDLLLKYGEDPTIRGKI